MGRLNTPTGAAFLSYASQDAAAAKHICEALRANGIEVWFDQSELRGGDAWDRKIRDQIRDCRLFIPVISANTERRDEGYFRREWALAADRTRDMAHKRTFLVPVVIDETAERNASVPEKFHELQWSRLPGGETPPEFVERIRRLLTPDSAARPAESVIESTPAASVLRRSRSKAPVWGALAVVVIACAYFVADKAWLSRRSSASTSPTVPTARHSAPSTT
ncbi:MAG: toll/interleukin-1 receptor domain-containing protein, partial [Gammaproteobacteria bacterium]|nr:toll/interleukin-1 receptor domain-containing protein [Gammaproteobacteria bacterium]